MKHYPTNHRPVSFAGLELQHHLRGPRNVLLLCLTMFIAGMFFGGVTFGLLCLRVHQTEVAS